MLNTNWSAQGVWTEPGARLDFRYEYIDQDSLLTGKVSADAEDEDHQEQNTLNQNLQVTFDYAFDDTFGISVGLPFVAREHTHWHRDTADTTEPEKEVWNFSEIGDVRVVGRMQLSSSASLHDAYGITAGLKLPTGDYKVTNHEGELAERSLQPGTGTTDAIVGGYYLHKMQGINAQWFSQISLMSALDKRDDFQSGNQMTFDMGYRQSLSSQLNAMLQFNYSHKRRDSGIQAEPENSGGESSFMSPGVSYSWSKTTQLYSFVHHRLSQRVNGEQLSAKNSFVVGMSTIF